VANQTLISEFLNDLLGHQHGEPVRFRASTDERKPVEQMSTAHKHQGIIAKRAALAGFQLIDSANAQSFGEAEERGFARLRWNVCQIGDRSAQR
jgi:hypothetical protein